MNSPSFAIYSRPLGRHLVKDVSVLVFPLSRFSRQRCVIGYELGRFQTKYLGECPHKIETLSPDWQRNVSAEGAKYSGDGEGCPFPSQLWVCGSVERSSAGSGRKRILAYFEGHRTLLFAPICRCFEFVKQCFMSHRESPDLGGGVNYPVPKR